MKYNFTSFLVLLLATGSTWSAPYQPQVSPVAAAEPSTMAPQQTERVTVRPEDTGAALVNPDMGWILMFYSNIPQNYGSRLEPVDTVDDWPGLSTVYLRIPWSFVEPEEGSYRWAVLDTPAQRWIAKGKRVAFRLTCSENWTPFATPEWVKNAGAQGVFYTWGKGPDPQGKFWDPVFDDPVFLAKLEAFLQALAARYDGNPDVAFIDIGSYGMWGEGHTGGSSHVPQAKANEIVRKHIDLHLKHFPRTRLAIVDDVAGPDAADGPQPLTDYACSHGLSLRDDSICVQPPPRSWFHAQMAQSFWPRTPVIVEHEHYGPSKERQAWGDGSLLIRAVEEYHASFLTIHWWPARCWPRPARRSRQSTSAWATDFSYANSPGPCARSLGSRSQSQPSGPTRGSRRVTLAASSH